MSTLKLTNNNYYSEGANKEYLSVSQYKDFYGTLGQRGCEAQALAKLSGKFTIEPSTAMLVGSYVDSYFEGNLEEFKEKTPDIFKKDGTLKADYKQAEEIIARIERDKKFMQYMSGKKQVIMTGELAGAQWKIKMDSYIPDKAIVDLKIVDDIYKSYYHRDTGKLSFIQERGYDFQLAVYQKIVEYNTGKQLPCFIAAADKGKVTNIEIIQITQSELDGAIAGIDIGVEKILMLKSGELTPERCGKCDFCKETKIITRPVTMSSLIEN